MERLTVWRARYELAWTTLLLWIARAGITGDPTPEVHAGLAVLYHRLADEHHARGRIARARKLRQTADAHERLGPPDLPDLPPAVAMRMPIPRSFRQTDARGGSMQDRRPRRNDGKPTPLRWPSPTHRDLVT